MNKLSHSAATKYQSCPKAYEYHYLHKLRAKKQSAALLFGSAVDAAFTTFLVPKSKKPEDVFLYFWRFQEVNKIKTFLPTCTDIVYSESDLDHELLSEEDITKLNDKFETEDCVALFKAAIKNKKVVGFDNLPEQEQLYINFTGWHILLRKGLLMVEAFKKKVEPQIEAVLGSQEYVKLENNEGDSIIGYADAILKWKDHSEPIIFDFKTSTKEYEYDSVIKSPQLTLYVHALGQKFKTRKAGFIVFRKQVFKNKTKKCIECSFNGTGNRRRTCNNVINGKRCGGNWIAKIDPEIQVQFIISEISARLEELVIENMDYINQSLKNGIFVRNLQSCIMPWGKCAYYDLCHKNSEKDLVKV